MLVSSSKALRCFNTGVRTFATAVDLPRTASTSRNSPRKAESWKPALPQGESALYDLALDTLEKGKQRQLDDLSEARRSGSKTEKELDGLEAEAFSRDPDVLWHFDHGLADYTKPVYRYLRQRRWRGSGDLALVIQSLKDDSVIPDLLPRIAPTVELIIRLDDAGPGGLRPGRPLTPMQTYHPPTIRAFVPHSDERLYTLALIDPDAPDEQNVSFQERWHWLRANVPLSPTMQDPRAGGDEILSYVPPHPERGTPTHRYVLVLAEQSGRIDASEPYQRLGQLLWRSYVERHQARTASAFHWVCRNNDNNRQTISAIYRKVLKTREPRFVRRYKVDKYRIYGGVGRGEEDESARLSGARRDPRVAWWLLESSSLPKEACPLAHANAPRLLKDFAAFQRLLIPQKGTTKVSSSIVNRVDLRGKTVLHHAVSSTEAARWDYVVALLACPSTNVNLQDVESGWTPLHRALYYGNLDAARALVAHDNVDLRIQDHEGLTAFDLYNASVDGVNPTRGQGAAELFAWGSNRNFTLGIKGDSDRLLPERVVLHKMPSADQVGKLGSFGGVGVRDVAMSKFQTGVVLEERGGNVRFCGSATDARVGKMAATRFSFESLPGFSSTIAEIAVATDHTILLDDRGDVFTLGMNHHGQLGYPLEGEETLQTAPKRVIGLRKEQVAGIAASRVHSVAFTADSLYTWGASRGQLGYSTPGSVIQSVPRKVSTLPSPVRSAVATEHATVCLLESKDVLVFQKNTYFKMVFNFQRFPFQSQQVYRPPALGQETKTTISKLAASGTQLVALSTLGDVFSWILDDSDVPQSTIARSPVRVWDRRKAFTGVVDVAVGNDTLIMATVSGHVFLRQKRMDVIKGADLRGANAATTSTRKLHKVTRVPFLQRVVRIAANDAGGFAAIRADASIAVPSTAGRSLSDDLTTLIPHLTMVPKQVDILRDLDPDSPASIDDFDERNPAIETELATVSTYVSAANDWDASWSRARGGADVVLVTKEGKEVPAHKVILAARSSVLQRLLDGKPADGGNVVTIDRKLNEEGLSRISFRRNSLLAVLLLLHYIYTDNALALWDSRLAVRLRSIGVASLRDELHALAHLLQLPALARVLALPERTAPDATLAISFSRLLDGPQAGRSLNADCLLELADDQTLNAHQAILRARCPFFAAMFDDDDWTHQRRQSSADGLLSLDLKSLDVSVMSMVLRHLYTDVGTELFRDVVRPTADAFIDFVFQVIAAANELLLDRLKAVCSAILCSFINLQTVGAILSDADFFHADDLAKTCMLYLSQNMETALEGRYLEDFPVALLRRLSDFCRQRQVKKLPISRSQDWIDDLLAKHVDFYTDLDLAKPVVGKRRWKFPTRSPRLSPAEVPLPMSVPTMPSPMLLSKRPSTSSPLLEPVAEPLESPPVSPLPQSEGFALVDDGAFAMDELDPAVTSPLSARTRSSPWAKSSGTAEVPALDLRGIMAGEASRTPQKPRLSAENAGMPNRPSQRDRRRKSETPPIPSPPVNVPMSSSPWRPPAMTGWRKAEAAKATSLSAIQSEQQQTGTPTRPARTPVTPTPPPARRPALQSANSSSPAVPVLSSADKASAVGVPVITPMRTMSSSKPKGPVTPGQDSAWVNYASSTSGALFSPPVPVIPSMTDASPSMASFAAIQNQQHDEGEAIRSARKTPKSFAEIQEEEAFMRWWSAESAKAQVSEPADSMTRGKRKPRGRGRGADSRGRGGKARAGTAA